MRLDKKTGLAHSEFSEVADGGSWQERRSLETWWKNRDILNFLWPQIVRAAHRRRGDSPGLSRDFEGCTGRCGSDRQPRLPIDVFWRARPATRNRHGGRECDRARLGKTRPCPFESGSAVCCREVFGQVTKGFFDSLSCGVVTILEVFERWRCETDLPHCSSRNAALKE